MITGTFRRVLSRLKHDGRIIVQNSFSDSRINVYNRDISIRSVLTNGLSLNQFPNEHGSEKLQHSGICTSARITTDGRKLLHYESNTILCKKIHAKHCHPFVNSVKQFSTTSEAVTNSNVLNTGVFKAIIESRFVEILQTNVINFHTFTGLPWWATIVLTTIALRTTITLPSTVYQLYLLAKLENIKYEMNGIAKKLQGEAQYAVEYLKMDKMYALREYNVSIKKERADIIARENIHPFKIVILGLLQLPIWVGLSFAIRNICTMLPRRDMTALENYMELGTSSFGWIPSLTETDPLFVLPVIITVSNLLNIEMQHMLKVKKPTTFGRYLINFMRILTVCLTPLMAIVPSSLSLYWATSCSYSVLQNFLLLSPKIRRIFRIPKTDTEYEHPYAELRKRIKSKLRFNVGKVESPTKL